MTTYNTKYRINWQSRLGNTNQIEIAELGYNGEVYLRNLGNGGAQLLKDEGEGIQGKSLTFAIKSTVDYEFIDMTVSNYRKNKVTYTKNGNIEFVGFLVQNQHTEPYRSAPYTVTLTALDGLGLLKNVTFTDIGVQTVFRTLDACISLSYVFLKYWVVSSLKEDTQTGTDGWLQAEINTAQFDGMTCYDVIQKILVGFGAYIEQTNGVWAIYHLPDLNAPRKVYSQTLVYEDTLNPNVFGQVDLSHDLIDLDSDLINLG
jgi:hypothetical protein